jgi:hypothetical protein
MIDLEAARARSRLSSTVSGRSSGEFIIGLTLRLLGRNQQSGSGRSSFELIKGLTLRSRGQKQKIVLNKADLVDHEVSYSKYEV